MEGIFIKLLNLSIQASILITVVLLLRYSLYLSTLASGSSPCGL